MDFMVSNLKENVGKHVLGLQLGEKNAKNINITSQPKHQKTVPIICKLGSPHEMEKINHQEDLPAPGRSCHTSLLPLPTAFADESHHVFHSVPTGNLGASSTQTHSSLTGFSCLNDAQNNFLFSESWNQNNLDHFLHLERVPWMDSVENEGK
jgi:hypothetical protein